MGAEPIGPIFFASPAEWRSWLEENHATASEVFVGFHKQKTGRRAMTWSEAVDEALCFGWIDGIVRRIDEDRYRQRFTPRKPTSNWSAVNIEKVAKLSAEGRMAPAGLAAFERRAEDRSRVYAFEQKDARLPPDFEARLRADADAWRHWESRPPGYKRVATWWVISAKRPETRERRMATLIEDSAAGRLIKSQRPPGSD